jgi:hypothetical protein
MKGDLAGELTREESADYKLYESLKVRKLEECEPGKARCGWRRPGGPALLVGEAGSDAWRRSAPLG